MSDVETVERPIVGRALSIHMLESGLVAAQIRALAPAILAIPYVLSWATAAGADSVPQHRALLNRYCVTCHNHTLKTAGLALDALDLARIGEHVDVWERVVRKVGAGLMP